MALDWFAMGVHDGRAGGWVGPSRLASHRNRAAVPQPPTDGRLGRERSGCAWIIGERRARWQLEVG